MESHDSSFSVNAQRLGARPIAFAHIVSDRATFDYLMDVFIVPEQRGPGHSKTLMLAVLDHP